VGHEADINVAVPARPDFLHVVRSVTASVAARLDLGYDDIEDLRIAVDEACAQLLSASGRAAQINLIITPSEGQVEVVVCTDGDVREWPPAGVEASLIWQILNGLTDAPSFERFDGKPGMRLVKAVAPAAGR
jgi:serine/threonine-protein kinase RsbW